MNTHHTTRRGFFARVAGLAAGRLEPVVREEPFDTIRLQIWYGPAPYFLETLVMQELTPYTSVTVNGPIVVVS